MVVERLLILVVQLVLSVFLLGGVALAKNRTYRAFVARSSHVLDLNGEMLDSASVLEFLASEVRDISSYEPTWYVTTRL